MAADPRTILLMNYYRDAELRGANLLFRLMSHLDDPDSQLKLSLHLADETRHAGLWTKRINDAGGAPARIADGYQNRIGLRVVPRNLIDILALTVVVEERAYQRYVEHAGRPNVPTRDSRSAAARSPRTRSGTSPGSKRSWRSWRPPPRAGWSA